MPQQVTVSGGTAVDDMPIARAPNGVVMIITQSPSDLRHLIGATVLRADDRAALMYGGGSWLHGGSMTDEFRVRHLRPGEMVSVTFQN